MERANYLISFIVLLFAFILDTPIIGQHTEHLIIWGIVENSQSNEPLENVNIYLSNSTIGTTSNSRGFFKIPNLKRGNYHVIISHVGYEERVIPVRLLKQLEEGYLIKLKPKPYMLPAVFVNAEDEKEWQRNIEKFELQLLGESYNGLLSELANPEVVSFATNNDDVLIATASEPLLIYNYALGYELTYLLESFESSKNYTRYAGYAVFKEFEPADKIEQKDWEINRERTYLGSIRHFLSSISDFYLEEKFVVFPDSPDITSIEAEGFLIRSTLNLPKPKLENPSWGIYNPNQYLSEGTIPCELLLSFPDYWEITYTDEFEEEEYLIACHSNRLPRQQVSWINLQTDTVAININGHYYDEFKIGIAGYWGFERICDMLPTEYEIADLEEPEEQIQ